MLISHTPAQQTFLDSLYNKLQQPELKDSAFNFFLVRSASLPEPIRNPAFQMLRDDLNELSPETLFNFTLLLSQSTAPHDPMFIWEDCVRRIEAEHPGDTLFRTRSLNYYAGALHAQGKISEAKSQYLKVISILPPDKIDEELAVAHNNLGAILNNLNDPGGALPNYLRARDIFMQLIGDEHVYIAVINNNIGQVYNQLGDYEAQVAIQEHARDIYLKTVGRAHRMTGNVFLNLGIAYKQSGFRERSMAAFREALAIREALHEHDGVVAALSEIAQLKVAFPDYYSDEEILTSQRAAISKGVTLFDSNHISLVSAYNNYGLQLLEEKRVEEALQFIQKSIEIRYQLRAGTHTAGGAEELTIANLPTVSQIGEPSFHDVKVFENKAYVLHEMYTLTGDQHYLEASLRTYLLGDSLIEILKAQLLNGASRKQLIAEANDYYIQATRTAMALHYIDPGSSALYLDNAYIFTEKSRNWELIDRYMQTRRNADILQNPILQNISMLRSQLPNIFSITRTPATDSLGHLIDVQLEELKEKYPEYFYFLYRYAISPLDSIQAFCAAHGVQWLHYFNLGHGKFNTVLCTSDTISVSQPENTDSLDIHRLALIKKISDKDWNFAEHAHALYELLFNGHREILRPGLLYISSAGYLDNIPLDILLTRDPRGLPQHEIQDYYLIQGFAIALHPSGTFGITTWAHDRRIRSSVFIAPEYSTQSLQYSGVEAFEGNEILAGRLLTGRVTSEIILSRLGDSDLFHFAGHASSNPVELDSIYLLIEEGTDTLYLSSFLSARSLAKIAVLSSCHSAAGRSSQEGNIGLAYGFAFAGTPQVLSSLWSVSDRETRQLFINFYRRFQEGTNSIESLRETKLSYLRDSPLPGQHPYYWANWVYYGHPVEFERRGFRWWWIGGILILAGLVVLVLWRVRS